MLTLANQRLKHLLFGTVPVRAANSGGCRNRLIQLLAHMSLPTTWCICLLCEHEVAAAAQGDLNIPLLTEEQCGSTKHQKHTWASEGIVKTSDSCTKWSYVAWGPTYKVLYICCSHSEMGSPLASAADSTASWCHNSGLCWVVLLDGHTWQVVKYLAGVDTLCHKGSPLSAHCRQYNSKLFYLGCWTL